MTPPRRSDDPAAPAPPAAPAARAAGRAEWLAFALSLGWLVLVVGVAWAMARRGTAPAEALVFVLVVLAVFLPVVLIWQTVFILRATRQLREEALRLRAMGGLMRDSLLQPAWQRHNMAPPGVDLVAKPPAPPQSAPPPPSAAPSAPTSAPPPDPIPGDAPPPLATTSGAGGAPAGQFTSRRAPSAGAEAAPRLSLEDPGGAPTAQPVPVDLEDLVRALHFPESEHDSEGFAALRRALRDHATADLIRHAQTVLAGLAEEGIFLDHLTPDRARPALWRGFAQGVRGPAMGALGGIRDRSCLALSVARMRADPAFRDAAHRFLRAFDARLTAIEPHASDTQIARLTDTRSARAFMLLGRIAGVFG